MAWSSALAGMQVLVGTGKHRLRLYDIRAHRRPALDLDFGTSRIVSLAVDPSGEFWLSSTSKKATRSLCHLNNLIKGPQGRA